ncbi:MAG: hypothetical protein WBB28_04405 [Crinalium sp.]
MEDLIFSTLVGIMTTVGMSLVMYQPKPKAPKAVTTTVKTETVTIAPPTIVNTVNEEVECDLWDATEVAITIAEIEPVETIEADGTAEIETAEIDETILIVEPVEETAELIENDETAKIDEAIAVVETTLTLVSNDIDLDKLPVTICKKVAGKLTKLNPELKISQSVNGASKPVSQLRAEIKNRVAKEPEMVMGIIKDAIASESKPSTKKPTTKTTKRNLKAVS